MDTKDPTYSSYLKVDELLSLQKPLTEPPAHDELLFIVIHQAYELWFKQVLFEASSLIKRIDDDEIIGAYRLLNRINTIFKVLVQQVDILETMTPVEFNRFRSRLNPASGFQSVQFRELETLIGADVNEFLKYDKLQPEWIDTVKARQGQPTLRSAFFDLLKRRELAKDDSEESIQKGILRVYYENDHQQIHNLCEQLFDFDEHFTLWRFRHVQMVERMIGMKRGTGGSLGVQYLKKTVDKRFFPELWAARTEMNGASEY